MKNLDKLILGLRGTKLNADRVTAEAEKRARQFVDDNLTNPNPMDYLLIETAVKIGVSIGLGEVSRSL